MDYSPCPEREIWPFLKGSHISETGRLTPTKAGVNARDIDSYLHEFFLADSDRLNFSTFMDHKLILSPKPERPHPPKSVCMHVTSIPTCINFLSQFQSIKFFLQARVARLQVLRLFWCPRDLSYIYICPHLKIIMPFIHVVLEECTP